MTIERPYGGSPWSLRLPAGVLVAVMAASCGGAEPSDARHGEATSRSIAPLVEWLTEPSYPYAMASGTAIIGTTVGLAGMDPQTGRTKWLNQGLQTVLSRLSAGQPRVVTVQARPDSAHVVAQYEGGFSVLHSETGEVAWTGRAANLLDVHIGDERLYLVERGTDTRSPLTLGYALEDGTLLFQEPGELLSVGVDGRILLRQPPGTGFIESARVSLRTRDGEPVWSAEHDVVDGSADDLVVFTQPASTREVPGFTTLVMRADTGAVLARRVGSYRLRGAMEGCRVVHRSGPEYGCWDPGSNDIARAWSVPNASVVSVTERALLLTTGARIVALDPRTGSRTEWSLCPEQLMEAREANGWVAMGCGRAQWDRSWRSGFVRVSDVLGDLDAQPSHRPQRSP